MVAVMRHFRHNLEWVRERDIGKVSLWTLQSSIGEAGRNGFGNLQMIAYYLRNLVMIVADNVDVGPEAH